MVAGILIVEELAVAESEVTATKDLGEILRYNDTRDDNERPTYYIRHQLFLLNTLCLISAFDVNLSIFCCDVSPSI